MEIKGYPNYLIYPDGSIKGKKRQGSSGGFLKQGICNKGYHHVALHKDKKQISKKVHRLVAEHYIPNPDNKPQVDHINRIRTDNRVENLRWVTTKEQNENKKLFANNKTGHKKISLGKNGTYVVRTKVNGKSTPSKSFKNKTDAICFKYIMLLKIKSNLFT